MMMTHRLPDLVPTDIMHSDFPDDFKTYVKEKDLLFQQGIKDRFKGRWWVFGSRENHRCDRPPPCSEIFDLGSETRIAATNPELITQSIKTVIEKIVGVRLDVLVQFWIAIKIGGGRTLLTTRDQPFGIRDGFWGYDGLCRYRLIFKDYKIYVNDDGESDEDNLGLPGRVFRHQKMESTPNVTHYSCKEYSERDRVVNINNVTGCMAVPVLEPSGQCCVGVLEVVTTSPHPTNFASKLGGAIWTIFEVVSLRSLKVYVPLGCFHEGDKKVKKAWAEIKKVLKRVCTTHELPFALTWGPCRNCNQAVIDDKSLFYYPDASYYDNPDASYYYSWLDFKDPCFVHPLGKGEGVVGTAFSSHNSAFCRDITQFSITKYPLAHHARDDGLKGCFAICLRSSYTGNDVYVLEFFLPPSKTEVGDPRITLVPLLTTMKQHFQSFTIASGEELGEELPIEFIDFSKDGKLVSFQISLTARSHGIENGGEQLVGVDATNTGNNIDSNTEKNNNSSKRQHRKAGIPISHEDIQQCSGMKIDDAAESLGVSRSTFKRACREYGISWWPPHKRKKDNDSLSNKSVQGAAQEQIQESTQPPISDPPHKHDFATVTHTEPQFMVVQDTSKTEGGDPRITREELPIDVIDLSKDDKLGSFQISQTARSFDRIENGGEMERLDLSGQQSMGVDATDTGNNVEEKKKWDLSELLQWLDSTTVTIKAKYEDDFLKFQLPMSSGMVEFKQEVAKRLNLNGGTYDVKYQDEDNDWILIACDEDL